MHHKHDAQMLIDCMLLFAPSVASSVRPGACSPIFYRGSSSIAPFSRVDLGAAPLRRRLKFTRWL